MEELEKTSFLAGGVCGGMVVAIFALLLNLIRVAQVKAGAASRSLASFPDAAQPGLTPAGIVAASHAATLQIFLLLILLFLFTGLVGAGCVYFLSP